MFKFLSGLIIHLPAGCRRRQGDRDGRRESVQLICCFKVKQADTDKKQNKEKQQKRKEKSTTSAAPSSILGGHASMCRVENSSALLAMDNIETHFCTMNQRRSVLHMATHA